MDPNTVTVLILCLMLVVITYVMGVEVGRATGPVPTSAPPVEADAA